MTNNIAKAQSLIRILKDNLSKRLPSSYSLVEQIDPAGLGDQLLISQHSPAVAGEQNLAIRILGQDTQFTDVIGNPQSLYSPEKAQVIEEASTIANVSLLTLANASYINWEISRMGVKQERYLNSNGTVPALSQFASTGLVTGSNFVETVSDLYWPLSGQ